MRLQQFPAIELAQNPESTDGACSAACRSFKTAPPKNWDPPYPPAGTLRQISELRDRLAASALPIAATCSDSRRANIRLY